MQFEAIGHLSQRFDAVAGRGLIAANATVRTRCSTQPEVEKLAERLCKSLAPLLGSESARIRLSVYLDQLCEECNLIVTEIPPIGQETFSAASLHAYLKLTEDFATPHSIPPTIVHEVCFLPSGHVIRYIGSGQSLGP